jgi:hypothetical protein
MSKLEGCTHEEVLRVLKDAGLGSLPGGGAEIFAPRVRQLIAPGKEPAEDWFHIHDTAHKLGIPTHCTLLYGHVETYEERVDHLLRLRAQQDATGGFLAFIPLAFHPENTVFERRGFKFTTGADDLKMAAVSRLVLDNIPNIKAYWIMMGMPMAQLALHFGSNDVQGTVVREKIFQAAGARRAGPSRRSRSSCDSSRMPGVFRCSATRCTTSLLDGERRRATARSLASRRHVDRLPGEDITPICRSKAEATARFDAFIDGAQRRTRKFSSSRTSGWSCACTSTRRPKASTSTSADAA